ncbi:glycosyltransferase family 39 protein [Candidatus Woesearchaeota archaeon]|nr:glycosyltransferase family 39 protein [Candidatus Woesearchaeota archaeon]
MDKKAAVWLALIVLGTLAIRLLFAFSTPAFTYDSYFHLRQVEAITETGFPRFQGELSYGGRDMRFLPFFHYIAALFTLFFPLELVGKILPNVLLSLLPIVVYLITREITPSAAGSLLAAFMSGFLPVLFSPNAFSVNSLFLPLVALAIYAFLRVQEKKFLTLYLIAFLFLSVTSSATVLLLIGFGIYLLLSAIEHRKPNRAEIEVGVFSLFFFLWVQFLFFKNTLLEEGLAFVWQNVPPQIVQQYFPQLSIFQSIILVGIIPFLSGIVITFKSLFQAKNKKMFLLVSLVIATTLLSWLRLIRFTLALAFFGIILAVLFALFYDETKRYVLKTKLARFSFLLPWGALLLLLFSNGLPAIAAASQQDLPTEQEIEAFRWLRNNTPENSTVAALVEEGHLITHYGKRKNVMDDQFARIPDIEKRFQDLQALYMTAFQTQALDILGAYEVDYLIVTPQAREKYSSPKYLTSLCFQRVYKNETKIYRVRCSLEETPELNTSN